MPLGCGPPLSNTIATTPRKMSLGGARSIPLPLCISSGYGLTLTSSLCLGSGFVAEVVSEKRIKLLDSSGSVQRHVSCHVLVTADLILLRT